MGARQKDVNTVNLMKQNKKIDTSKTHFTVQNLIFSKRGIRKLKGEWAYKIKRTSVDWGENAIAIEIHCDAGNTD